MSGEAQSQLYATQNTMSMHVCLIVAFTYNQKLSKMRRLVKHSTSLSMWNATCLDILILYWDTWWWVHLSHSSVEKIWGHSQFFPKLCSYRSTHEHLIPRSTYIQIHDILMTVHYSYLFGNEYLKVELPWVSRPPNTVWRDLNYQRPSYAHTFEQIHPNHVKEELRLDKRGHAVIWTKCTLWTENTFLSRELTWLEPQMDSSMERPIFGTRTWKQLIEEKRQMQFTKRSRQIVSIQNNTSHYPHHHLEITKSIVVTIRVLLNGCPQTIQFLESVVMEQMTAWENDCDNNAYTLCKCNLTAPQTIHPDCFFTGNRLLTTLRDLLEAV